ncbi:MAG: putative peptidoglycan glycosyltransferase FtsW [Verrucomicrobiota bacterium JB022]|nr:putative peptidoglycan glycosyltransferase FtsW [Verrucomicrobiota bacterium JB022]
MNLVRRGWVELVIVLLVGCLCWLGLLMLYSIGRGARPGLEMYYFTRQAIFMGVALMGMLVAWRLNLEHLRSLAWPIAAAGLLLLVIVLIPGIGKLTNGARRWIIVGPLTLQATDIAKIALLFALSHFLAINQRYSGTFLRGFVLPGIIIGLPVALIFLEPDYGTAVLFAVVGGILLFLAGVRLYYLIPAGIGGAAAVAYLISQDPVRLARITAFLDVQGNAADGTYQLQQGIIGFGVGGLEGAGLGQGRQQLSFLPEAHTDFIFPIIGEELGLLATCLVVTGFALFFALVTTQLRRAPNLFQFLLVTGAMLFITLQALINFGVSTGLLPTKGMSLPMISYGGSNLLGNFILIGLILNCLHEWRRPLRNVAGEVAS